ncbi:hypothetical protein DERP_006969 [Dermatophagoides pteronyssinus]|uniref:Uncharacterized protein n=1 Tax=Dermatophagoides pteronyssinus TaxID=6956 RepID=A0ABQ8JTV5_DERPT|nr:hypothetical protein DERP_006969 [Dermatophagoides pteronyssinus]
MMTITISLAISDNNPSVMMMDQLFRQHQPMYSQDRNRGMSGGEGRGGQQRRRNGGRRRMRNGNGGGCRYEDGNNENNQMDTEE